MSWVAQAAVRCTVVVALLLALISGLSLALPGWWVLELLSHPRPQYLLLLVCCLPSLVLRYRRAGWLLLLPIALNAALLLSLYAPLSPPPAGPSWSVLHYNLDRTAPDHRAAFAYLRSQRADLLSLQEVTPELLAAVAVELPDYRVAFAIPRDTTQGSALLVRRASELVIAEPVIVHLPEGSSRPMLAATLVVAGRELSFLSMQATRPRSAATSAFQAEEFAAIAAWSRFQQRERARPLLAIGDINTTPWSDRFRRLLADGELSDSARGYGLQPTWPAGLPSLLAIPIDHCLVSPELVIVGRSTGPALGGDHTPLLVQFRLAPP